MNLRTNVGGIRNVMVAAGLVLCTAGSTAFAQNDLFRTVSSTTQNWNDVPRLSEATAVLESVVRDMYKHIEPGARFVSERTARLRRFAGVAAVHRRFGSGRLVARAGHAGLSQLRTSGSLPGR